MSGTEELPKGNHQMHSHRRRTIFTEKQLEALKVLYDKNPYPNPSLQKEMASKIDIHPTVLQVWFKNQRAKLKKAKCKDLQQQPQAPQQPEPMGGVKTSPSQEDRDTQPRTPSDNYPIACVYADSQVPWYQLCLYPSVKAPADVFLGHRIVHFGCCQDPNIYCLYPILESQVAAPCFPSNVFGCKLLQSRER
uniref:Homeobox domain-containing protein n=1 Tax=Otolemur garnettii TaxID=30611 RepID=H0XM51_OTOGA